MTEQPPATPPKPPAAAAMAEPNSNPSEPGSIPQPDPLPSSTPPPPPPASLNPSAAVAQQPAASLIPPPLMQPYASYRPVMQFSNPSLPQAMSYQPQVTPVGVPPPGVMMPATGQVQTTGVMMPVTGQVQTAMYGQPMRPLYAPMPNGYQGMPQSSIPPPGVLRYPTPYAPMYRQPYPPRPTGVMPPILRPPVAGIRPPIVPLIARPPVPKAAPEKQTTVYVGKIATSVENDFILSLLQLCGPVKSWKRPQNPTDGTYKGFGFCEFESAEGVLRALRLLSKLNLDGQELMMNVNQATRDYLEQFVENKVESLKSVKEDGTETESEQVKTGEGGDTKMEASKFVKEGSGKDGAETKDKENDASCFGLVSDEDRQADLEASEKLTGMIEERLRNKPLPPPPPPPALPSTEGYSFSNLEGAVPSKEGDMDVDRKEAAEDKNEDEMTPLAEQERPETTSPDRDRRHDRRGRDRDQEMKREKERELERYERSRELDRAKREKEREYRLRDDERRCKAREKDWESREKEKEHWRQREKEREKERAKVRKEEIIAQERESDGGYSRKRKHRSSDDERRRRQREKEEDIADSLKEEEEIAEAKKRAEEEEKRKQHEEEELKALSASQPDKNVLLEENNLYIVSNGEQHGSDSGDVEMQNGDGDGDGEDIDMFSDSATDGRQNNSAPAKKLGFGLQGLGKRTAVPSVFKQDEEDELQKKKKMRPLVPIDYSTEEQMAVHSPVSTEAPASNPVSAPDFSRRGSGTTSKEERADKEKERADKEKERSRRSHDRSSHRDRDRGSDEAIRNKDESRKEDREKAQESNSNKAKPVENKKLLDAKQLIDMIPKTKDELFSYTINWYTYDKNSLHERLKPWITKKITEFLGEEEPTLVDYIMSSTKEHVAAAEMLNRLQGILDEEAEMFVLKMWRMLIFEIKRVEAGLPMRPRA